MTVRSWMDIPAGVAVHHHCVVSVEKDHDPKFWVDASTATPSLIAWQYPDAVDWVRDQLAAYRDEAAEGFARQSIDDLLDAYAPSTAGLASFARNAGAGTYIPSMWERLPNTLRRGRWVMETCQLGIGRKLVMQVLGFADAAGQGRYPVCDQHRRPADKPYLGVTDTTALV